jgi:hypothetical protein
VAIVGRQSGKTQTAGDVIAFEAATAPRDGDADGTYALAVAQDQRGAMRALFRYAVAPFDRVPMLMRTVGSQRTADSLVLENGVTLAAYPCRPSAVRGIRALVAVVDELAFFRSSDGNAVDTEMLRAIRPTLATTSGKLIVLSSPYWGQGCLYDLHRVHFGRDDSDVLVWVGSAPVMHPGLSADYLRRMEQDDPEAFRSEVLGEFRAGLSNLFDPDALEACTQDWREQPPQDGVRYRGHFDASSGRQDAAALAIAYQQAGVRSVVACVRARGRPRRPSAPMW